MSELIFDSERSLTSLFSAKISDVFDNSMSATFKIVDFIFIFTRIEQ